MFQLSCLRATAALIGLLAFSLIVPAQKDACGPRTVFVNVEDDKHQPVTGLTSADFRGVIGKQIIPVTIDTSTPRVRRIVFLLDVSTSMRTEDKRRGSMVVAAELARKFPPEVAVALELFNDESRVAQVFTTDHELIRKQLAMLSPSNAWNGATAAWSSIISAIDLLSQPEPGDAIVLISDGGDDFSKTKPSEVERRLIESNLRFFMVGLSPQEIPGMRSNTSRTLQTLDDIAARTGGMSFWLGKDRLFRDYSPARIEFQIAKDFRNVSEIADLMVRETLTGYRILLTPDEPVTKPVDLNLEIVADSGRKRKSLHARYPHQLFPCKATPKNN